MPSKIYAVTLHVSEGNLGTVLSALAGSSTLVSVVPTEKTAAIKSIAIRSSDSAEPKRFGYVGNKRNKGISGEDLALKTLASANRIFDIGEIFNAFTSAGFAANSASPVLSVLTRANKIRALGNGRFCALGTTVRV